MTFLFISPIRFSTPDLFDTFTDTFLENGHSITTDVDKADFVFFDLHNRFADYDTNVINRVLLKKIPVAIIDNWDYWGCKGVLTEWHEMWNSQEYCTSGCDWFRILHQFKQNGNIKVYFVRKFCKTDSLPLFVYPLEYIQLDDFPITTKEELFNRQYDVSFLGNSSIWRSNIVCGILKDGRLKEKTQFRFHRLRLEYREWISWHKQSKFFIESDGGGFGSERPFHLMTISPMLRQHNEMGRINDWEHGVDCIEIGKEDPMGIPTTQEIDYLIEVLNDKDRLYDIYIKGAEKMKNYFNANYRANYVLDVLKINGL